MKKIKIAHIITQLELGGAQSNTLYTVEHLPRDKYEVILISGSGGILDESARKIADLKTYFLDSLIRPINPFIDISALIQLFRILNTERPDIVHTHSSKAGILGRWAAYFAGVPHIVHTFHGFGFNSYQKIIVQIIFIFIEQITAFISDRLIAVSQENIEKGLNYFIATRNKYILIRSGIDISKFQNIQPDKNKKRELGLSADKFIVGMVACFKPQKSPLDFVRMANLVRKQVPETEFVIVGDGELRPAIEKEINKYSLANSFKLLGWRNDLPDIMSTFDIFVLTSLWEGLPRVILEAFAMQKPVVATAVDGTREMIENNNTGFLAPPRKPGIIAELVCRLLKDKELRERIGKAGKNSLNNCFTIQTMVSQINELYFSLTNQ